MLENLEALNRQLLKEPSLFKRLQILDRYVLKAPAIAETEPLERQYVLKQLAAIGEGEAIDGLEFEKRENLIERLLVIDRFYKELGGIIGYQIEILRRLKKGASSHFEGATFHSPRFYDITKKGKELSDTILSGLRALPQMAEFYPLGGAADRLHLVDEKTKQELPAAKMVFGGKTLLERLIADLKAREHLYYCLFGEKVEVPICIMTSLEKGNHRHVINICEEHRWFGRSKESFRFFSQPLVPAVNGEGRWLWQGVGLPVLKPGGHGAIWKLARDEGVFDWLSQKGVTHALVRQINNPLAGTDYGLLAFLGYGIKKEMSFGFVSCPRLLQAAEGVNVLVEKKGERGIQRVLTNIEYCDFSRFKIEDSPLEEGLPYSRYTSNTNILFAHLPSIKKAVDEHPFPGLLINLKKGSYRLETGEKKEEVLARLESTMQNIGDVFVEEGGLDEKEMKKTFIIYNHRHKTISTAKKAYIPGSSLQETPEQCFYDLLKNSYELLQEVCSFDLPLPKSLEKMIETGPESAFLYHPILGPLYSIIGEKIKKGKMELGSELILEGSDFYIENLNLDGSLQIRAEELTCGKCVLKNVTVKNRGVDWSLSKPFWRGQWSRFESAEITLLGDGEFFAEGVELLGSEKWVVKEGTRLILRKGEKPIIEMISKNSRPLWEYKIDLQGEIVLTQTDKNGRI